MVLPACVCRYEHCRFQCCFSLFLHSPADWETEGIYKKNEQMEDNKNI